MGWDFITGIDRDELVRRLTTVEVAPDRPWVRHGLHPSGLGGGPEPGGLPVSVGPGAALTACMLNLVEPCKRRVTYRLYPSPGQEARLLEYRALHCELYNAALQERRDAWRLGRTSVRKGEQEKQLPEIKRERPELAALGGHALQETLRRVDLAFAAFFRRVKAGDTPGYPRFKSWKRYPGWTYKSGSNWSYEPGPAGRHGWIAMDGIGRVRVRGRGRQPGLAKTLTILHKAGRWYASLVLELVPARKRGAEEIGFDWGIESFLTLDSGEAVPNPRLLRQAEERLERLQREVSSKRRGSRNRRKAVARLARAHERVANQRQDFLHQESAALVSRASLLATEQLAVANMTASAKGTAEAPGRGVRQKAGLNKSILDGALSAFLAMLRYKAEEAGTALVEAPTRSVKPSQTCPACGARARKALAQREHSCPCGCALHRDHAAALVLIHYARTALAGNRPRCGGAHTAPNHETATEAA